MTTNVKDRRKFRRIPRTREAAVFQYTDENDRPVLLRGRLADISAGGAALQAADGPELDTSGELKIQFDGFQLVSVCKVVRKWSGGFAVEFTDIDENTRTEVTLLPDDE